jgi:hypothetical protein
VKTDAILALNKPVKETFQLLLERELFLKRELECLRAARSSVSSTRYKWRSICAFICWYYFENKLQIDYEAKEEYSHDDGQ